MEAMHGRPKRRSLPIIAEFGGNSNLCLGLSRCALQPSARVGGRLETPVRLAPEQQAAASAEPNVVRLSIGIKDPDDLIEDLNQALAKATA